MHFVLYIAHSVDFTVTQELQQQLCCCKIIICCIFFCSVLLDKITYEIMYIFLFSLLY